MIKGKYSDIITPANRRQLGEPLESFLLKRGSSVGEFNKYIEKLVSSTNGNMREAYVKVIMAITYEMEQKYGVKLPCTYGGEHKSNLKFNDIDEEYKAGESYGVNPNWGLAFNVNQINRFTHPDGTKYHQYGPDCSGIVAWGLHNAGGRYFDKNTRDISQGYFGETTVINGRKFIGEPGDLIHVQNHMMSIVAMDHENEIYYTAEAAGGRVGVVINERSLKTLKGTISKEFKLIDMTNYYETSVKKLEKTK